MKMVDGKVNMVRLGDYIEVFNNTNKNGCNYPFYGINKDKDFMPTVANTDGLDVSKYTILEKGMFVFSGMQTGRDVCIRIGLYDKESPVLISPAYITFKVIDENCLLPQYLFLYFNRFEMDRYGWFLSDSSIRSNLDWDRFCEIQIPLPSIETQRELVAVYNGLKELAEQNEAMLDPLAHACEAFIINCKKNYTPQPLGEYIEECKEKNTEGKYSTVMGLSTQKMFREPNSRVNKNELAGYKIVEDLSFAYVPTTDTWKVFACALNHGKTIVVSPIYCVFKVKDQQVLLPDFLNIYFKRAEFDRYARYNSWGSARENFAYADLCAVQIPIPPIVVQEKIVALYRCYEECKRIATEAREQLKTICPALVQRGYRL